MLLFICKQIVDVKEGRNLNTIGEKLRNLRGDKTLEEVSNEVGVTTQALWNYEKDIRVPRDEIKLKLCKYYNVSVEEVFFKY